MDTPNMMATPPGGPLPAGDGSDTNETQGAGEYDCTCPKCGHTFTVELEDGKAVPEDQGGSDDSASDNGAGTPDLGDEEDGASSFRFARK